jgi:unsaturated chondroitin disaccharide hydrolase
MLSKIVEEPLRECPGAPFNRQAFSDELDSARQHTLELIRRHLTEFGEKFPAETCEKGYYPLTDNVEWTTSFWTGQLWLAWEMSGDAAFRAMAEKMCALLACALRGAATLTRTISAFFIRSLALPPGV